jgi:hypothetical protein
MAAFEIRSWTSPDGLRLAYRVYEPENGGEGVDAGEGRRACR